MMPESCTVFVRLHTCLQPEIGKTFAKVFKEGKVHRKDVWITSKLWNAHHKPEEVARVSHLAYWWGRCTCNPGTCHTRKSTTAC